MSVIHFGPPKRQLGHEPHHEPHTRRRRGAAAEEPSDERQAFFRELLEHVEVVSEQWAALNDKTSIDVRYPRSLAGEIEDRAPEPTAADGTRYRVWLEEMAERLHQAIDVEKKTVQRVNCQAGRARSPATVLAWLRRYHGLQHLQWALAALQERNRQAGHMQELNGRFEGLLESLDPV